MITNIWDLEDQTLNTIAPKKDDIDARVAYGLFLRSQGMVPVRIQWWGTFDCTWDYLDANRVPYRKVMDYLWVKDVEEARKLLAQDPQARKNKVQLLEISIRTGIN
jgi:hypothetical protein